MEISCPACGAQGRLDGYTPGQEVRCTRCEHTWAPRSAPAPAFQARTLPRTLGSRMPDIERWLAAWCIAAGIGLLLGFILPLILEHRSYYSYEYRSRTETIWFWDLLDHARGGQVLGILLPALVGITALIVRGTMRGRARAITIFSLGAGAVVVSFALTADTGLFGSRYFGFRGLGDGVAVGILILLAASAIAVGNRIRKHHPAALLPRLLAGIGGCVLVLMFLVPIKRGHAGIEAFFEGKAWEDGWPVMLIGLTLLAYGITAICHFAKVRTREGLCRGVSTLGRIVIIGAPIAFLVMVLVATNGKGILTGLIMGLKVTLLAYGTLALLGVGLTAWLTDVLEGGGTGASAAPASAAPALGDLKSRLERLKAALDDGLLTPEEYEAKRKQIVDSAEF